MELSVYLRSMSLNVPMVSFVPLFILSGFRLSPLLCTLESGLLVDTFLTMWHVKETCLVLDWMDYKLKPRKTYEENQRINRITELQHKRTSSGIATNCLIILNRYRTLSHTFIWIIQRQYITINYIFMKSAMLILPLTSLDSFFFIRKLILPFFSIPH